MSNKKPFLPSSCYSSSVKQQGIYLVLTALLLATLISVIAYFIGVSMLAVGNLRLQNISNLAVVAGLDGYMKAVPGVTRLERIYRAKESAEAVISKNTVFFGRKLQGEVEIYGLGSTPSVRAATLQFGVWNKKAPTSSSTTAQTCTNGSYPCFNPVPLSSTSTAPEEKYINAAQILMTPADQFSLRIPIVSTLLPTLTLDSAPSSIARVVERCVVMLLDVSLSTASESHNYTPYAQVLHFTPDDYPFPTSRAACRPGGSADSGCVHLDDQGVDYTSYFANTSGRTHSYVIGLPKQPRPPAISARNAVPVDSCSNPPQNQEQMWWCNLGESRRTGSFYPIDGPLGRNPVQIRANPLAITPKAFRTDYGLFDTKIGRYYIDRRRDIEPLTTYLLSFNAALRTMREVTSQADKAAVIAFTGTIRDRVPASGMVSDMGQLIQLTNGDNGGYKKDNGAWKAGQSPQYPNHVERGWFPIIDEGGTGAESGTNINLAMSEAIKTIDQSCSKDSRKVIILATDGIMSWDYDLSGSAPFRLDRYYGRDPGAPTDSSANIRQPTFPNGEAYGVGSYWYAERRLLSDQYNASNPSRTGILAELKKRNISVTVLLAGSHLSLNILNIWTNLPAPGLPTGHFLSVDEFPYHGFSGLGTNIYYDNDTYVPMPLIPPLAHYPDPTKSTDPEHPCRLNSQDNFNRGAESCAWRFAGKWNFDDPNDPYAYRKMFFFSRPIGVMGDLAWQSGGVMCPLMWPYGGSFLSNHDGDSSTPEIWEEYYWDHDGDPTTPKIMSFNYRNKYRGLGLWGAPEDMEPGEYAARCTRRAIESDPYELVISAQ